MLRFFVGIIFGITYIYAAGWSIVGDTFTEEQGKCEFDFWLHTAYTSQNLGFYTDCVISPSTSLQIASNTSSQSIENQAFIELEQSFYTTKDRFFNIGMILGDGISKDKSFQNNLYAYIPISFNWLDEKLRTTLNLGIASNQNFQEQFFTFSGSISGNLTEKIWLVGEFSLASQEKVSLDSSFYQVGASFLIYKDSVSLDIAYLNAFDHAHFGSIKIGIAFYTKIF